ncbi:MAG: DUF4160 domain-containing protein [Candidatus Brocadiaceae bacterium]
MEEFELTDDDMYAIEIAKNVARRFSIIHRLYLNRSSDSETHCMPLNDYRSLPMALCQSLVSSITQGLKNSAKCVISISEFRNQHLRLPKAVVFMISRRHKRPHIHAKYQDSEAVISIPNGDLLDGELPPAKMRLVLAWIEIHKMEL